MTIGIKNIFFPNCFGSYYLFEDLVVSVEILTHEINVVGVRYAGFSRTIEFCIKKEIVLNEDQEYKDAVINILQSIIRKIGLQHSFIAVVQGTTFFYKSLSFPLVSDEKIKQMIPFEIEKQLPFSLDAAAYSHFIVDDKETSRSVFVVATQYSVIDVYKKFFADIDSVPSQITTDLVSIYRLYELFYPYKTEELILLLVLGKETTKLCLVQGKLIKSTRVLSGHITDEMLVHKEDLFHNEELCKHMDALFEDISLSLEVMLSNESEAHLPVKTLLFDTATVILGIEEYVHRKIGIPCELFSINYLIQSKKVKCDQVLDDSFVVPIAAALSYEFTDNFNLDHHSMESLNLEIVERQLFTAAIISLMVFLLLIGNSFFRIRGLKSELNTAEQEAAEVLIKRLELSVPKGKKLSLEQLNTIARSEVIRKEAVWSALSEQNRYLFLTYLQELGKHIDIKKLGLEIHHLTITTEMIVMEGHVKSFAALRLFEEDLEKSTLFKTVSKPQDLSFNIKIIPEKKQP